MDWRRTKTFKICSLLSLVVLILKERQKVLWNPTTIFIPPKLERKQEKRERLKRLNSDCFVIMFFYHFIILLYSKLFFFPFYFLLFYSFLLLSYFYIFFPAFFNKPKIRYSKTIILSSSRVKLMRGSFFYFSFMIFKVK